MFDIFMSQRFLATFNESHPFHVEVSFDKYLGFDPIFVAQLKFLMRFDLKIDPSLT